MGDGLRGVHAEASAMVLICVHIQTSQCSQPPHLSFFLFFSSRVRGHLQMLLDPREDFHWQSDGVPSSGLLSPLVPCAQVSIGKLRPGLPYSLAPELCPCRVARRCGPSQGCNPFDLKDTLANAFTLIYPTSIAQRRIRAGWVGKNTQRRQTGRGHCAQYLSRSRLRLLGLVLHGCLCL